MQIRCDQVQKDLFKKTMDVDYPNLSADERLLAGISLFMGFLIALLIWVIKKDESRFIRFQAAQAMAFDALIFLTYGVFLLCLFLGMFLAFGMVVYIAYNLPMAQNNPGWLIFFALLPISFIFLVLPATMLIIGVRFYAGISALMGRNFHYPWLGKQVERFLQS